MIITDLKNQKWIVKFKYEKLSNEQNIKDFLSRKQLKEIGFKCSATICWEEKVTVCSIRKIEEPIYSNISVKVHCKKSEVFKKNVGRELAFIRLINNSILNFSHKDKKAFIKAYNEKFAKKI
jgi:hypothetical protein